MDVAAAVHRTRCRPDGGNVLVATGNRAGVYALDPDQGATQWLAAPEGQVTALARDAQGPRVRGDVNPAALWTLGPGQGGARRIAVADARRATHRAVREAAVARRVGRRARGRAVPRAAATLDPARHDVEPVERRSAAGEDARRDRAPPARYLPVAARCSPAATPRVESRSRPRGASRTMPPAGSTTSSVAPQELQGSARAISVAALEPVTQQLPSGQQRRVSLPHARRRRPLRRPADVGARLRARCSGSGVDPNGDPLRYTIDSAGGAGREAWIQLAPKLDADRTPSDTVGARTGATARVTAQPTELERRSARSAPPRRYESAVHGRQHARPVVTSRCDARGEASGFASRQGGGRRQHAVARSRSRSTTATGAP